MKIILFLEEKERIFKMNSKRTILLNFYFRIKMFRVFHALNEKGKIEKAK
jgi:hypothetical protein